MQPRTSTLCTFAPTADTVTATVEQIERLVGVLGDDSDVPMFVFDAGYDSIRARRRTRGDRREGPVGAPPWRADLGGDLVLLGEAWITIVDQQQNLSWCGCFESALGVLAHLCVQHLAYQRNHKLGQANDKIDGRSDGLKDGALSPMVGGVVARLVGSRGSPWAGWFVGSRGFVSAEWGRFTSGSA